MNEETQTMKVPYQAWTNISSNYWRGYEAGDRLVAGWRDELDILPGTPEEIAELVYVTHNHDDRPDGQMCPSMSIGDVITLWPDEPQNRVSLTVKLQGFEKVEIDPSQHITDRSWRDVWCSGNERVRF